MSMDMGASLERVCYVHCTFCSTILAVSVPWSSMYDMVTVRCGHCANLLSVNMTAASSHPPPPLSLGSSSSSSNNSSNSIGSSSTYTISSPSDQLYQPRTPPIRPPEKRQRVPSAYNKFIKEEIQRIKASNPEISHREAFSTAAKNWAHFPNIQFGLKYEEAKLDKSLPAAQETLPSSHGFY